MSNEELLSTLYNRHAAALSVVAQDSNERVHIDAARMALALMARELADKLYSAQHDDDASINLVVVRQVEQLLKQYAADLYERLVAGEFATIDQALSVLLERNNQALQSVIDLRDNEVVRRQNAEHRIVELDAENARLRTELAAAVDERNFADRRCAELEQQLLQLDADNTALIARCNQMERDLLALQQQRDELSIDNLHLQAQVDALTVHVATLEEQLSGATAAGHGTLAQIEMRNDGASVPVDYTGIDWSSLSEQAQDYRIGLDYHRWKWRDVPKPIRLELVRCVIRNAGEFPTQTQFDAIRPPWMATATSQCAAFGAQWSLLANLDREIEVAP